MVNAENMATNTFWSPKCVKTLWHCSFEAAKYQGHHQATTFFTYDSHGSEDVIRPSKSFYSFNFHYMYSMAVLFYISLTKVKILEALNFHGFASSVQLATMNRSWNIYSSLTIVTTVVVGCVRPATICNKGIISTRERVYIYLNCHEQVHLYIMIMGIL